MTQKDENLAIAFLALEGIDTVLRELSENDLNDICQKLSSHEDFPAVAGKTLFADRSHAGAQH